MKKTFNKKGFTLVELLAVIVILAVIVLIAMNAVIPQMEKARKNAFLTEVETFGKAAQTWYTAQKIGGSSELTETVTLTDLKASYVKKNDAAYKGIVTINNTNGTITTTVCMTSGAYYFNGNLDELKIDNIKEGNGSITGDACDSGVPSTINTQTQTGTTQTGTE